MNKNYSKDPDELTTTKSVLSQLRSAFISPKVLIYSAIILLLLLVSTISRA